MYKIATEIFYPFDSKDSWVKLISPSYGCILKFYASHGQKTPADGPQPASEANLINMEFMRYLCKSCVVEVHGIQLDDRPIKTGEELFDLAPSKVMEPIIAKLTSMLHPSEEDKKKSA